MPELPEVETVKTGLEKSISGKRIDKVVLNREGLRRPFPENMADNLQNRVIESVSRRGKYILCNLSNNVHLIMHLGMSGRISVYEANKQENVKKHDHMLIIFSNRSVLCFNDPRRFGLVDCFVGEPQSHKIFIKMGIEPLSKEFDADHLYMKLQNKSGNIKNALLDQGVVAGLGNIYVCEALFEAGISPLRKSREVSFDDCKNLVVAIRNVLGKAIKAGGSTLRDYKNIDGDSGYFQHSFSVYGREGKSCPLCSKQNRECSIKRIVQSGRSGFYCDRVQS